MFGRRDTRTNTDVGIGNQTVHGLPEQVVDGTDRALVFQEGQRAPVGNADLFVQTLRVFFDLVGS
jgi:hypothetical protein